jgi:hypothetical protein
MGKGGMTPKMKSKYQMHTIGTDLQKDVQTSLKKYARAVQDDIIAKTHNLRRTILRREETIKEIESQRDDAVQHEAAAVGVQMNMEQRILQLGGKLTADLYKVPDGFKEEEGGDKKDEGGDKKDEGGKEMKKKRQKPKSIKAKLGKKKSQAESKEVTHCDEFGSISL